MTKGILSLYNIVGFISENGRIYNPTLNYISWLKNRRATDV